VLQEIGKLALRMQGIGCHRHTAELDFAQQLRSRRDLVALLSHLALAKDHSSAMKHHAEQVNLPPVFTPSPPQRLPIQGHHLALPTPQTLQPARQGLVDLLGVDALQHPPDRRLTRWPVELAARIFAATQTLEEILTTAPCPFGDRHVAARPTK